MKLFYNKRSTEWLKKGIPGNIKQITMIVNSQEETLNEYRNIEVETGSNLIGATIELSNGEVIKIEEKEFNVERDMQLHILFASKNYKIQNMIINPKAFALLLLASVFAALIPILSVVLISIGMLALVLIPNTYVYKKHGSDAFKILLT